MIDNSEKKRERVIKRDVEKIMDPVIEIAQLTGRYTGLRPGHYQGERFRLEPRRGISMGELLRVLNRCDPIYKCVELTNLTIETYNDEA